MRGGFKKAAAIFIASTVPIFSYAQEDNISPLYFGPNALPVPDMLDGSVSPRWYGEITYDHYSGFYGDRTETINAKVNIPLFSKRVNLSLWMPVIEFYHYTPESLEHFQPLDDEEKGYEFGNVYISIDIQVLLEREIRPSVIVRAAYITASGDGDEYSRYYDAPGYFFDGSISKSFRLGGGFFESIRFVFNGGFLCWQMGKHTQNDAYMYGAKTIISAQLMDLSVAWQGYSGWMDNGDMPQVIKSILAFKVHDFRPLLGYEYGLRDYPYHHFKIGLGYLF